MKMCDGHGTISHEEIVFDCYKCPLCEAFKSLDECEKKIASEATTCSVCTEEHVDGVEKLKAEIERLKDENEQLRRGVDPAIEQKSW